MGIQQMFLGAGAGGINPREHFDVTLWTGAGASPRTITQGGDFTPDLIWIKSRSHATHHYAYDSVRGFGANKELVPSTTDIEGDTSNHNTIAHGYISGAGSQSFTTGAGSTNQAYTDSSGRTYVAWTWNAGGSTVSNTDGSITSSVRANTDAGFSIVSYTGTGSSATVGHGLEATPSLIITKGRDDSGLSWATQFLGSASNYMQMQDYSGNNSSDGSAAWGSDPTSSVFSINTKPTSNNSGTAFIAYVWSEVAGFSKFGTYDGSGANGNEITLGFRPKMLLIKRTDGNGHYNIIDSERGGADSLHPNEPDWSSATATWLAFNNDGFTLTDESGISINIDGYSYVYAAWA